MCIRDRGSSVDMKGWSGKLQDVPQLAFFGSQVFAVLFVGWEMCIRDRLFPEKGILKILLQI